MFQLGSFLVRVGNERLIGGNIFEGQKNRRGRKRQLEDILDDASLAHMKGERPVRMIGKEKPQTAGKTDKFRGTCVAQSLSVCLRLRL